MHEGNEKLNRNFAMKTYGRTQWGDLEIDGRIILQK